MAITAPIREDETSISFDGGSDLVKVEYFDGVNGNGNSHGGGDDQIESAMPKIRADLLDWFKSTIRSRRVMAADLFPQAVEIARTYGIDNLAEICDAGQFTNNFLRRNSIKLQEQPFQLTDDQNKVKQVKDGLAKFFQEESEKRLLYDSYNMSHMINWSMSSRWSFGPKSASGSIETTTIGNTHHTL